MNFLIIAIISESFGEQFVGSFSGLSAVASSIFSWSNEDIKRKYSTISGEEASVGNGKLCYLQSILNI